MVLLDAYGDTQAFSRIRSQLSKIDAVVKQENGATIKTIGETVVAIFPTQLAAFQCAEQLCTACDDTDIRVGAVIHCGPAVVATLDDRLDYFGQLVHESLSFLDLCQPGSILTTAQTTASSDIQQRLSRGGRQVAAVEHESHALVSIGISS